MPRFLYFKLYPVISPLTLDRGGEAHATRTESEFSDFTVKLEGARSGTEKNRKLRKGFVDFLK